MLAWVAVLVLVASACGTSGDKKAAPTTKATTTTTTTTSTTSTDDDEHDHHRAGFRVDDDRAGRSRRRRPRAKAANIVAGDFPAGWTPRERSTGESTIVRAVRSGDRSRDRDRRARPFARTSSASWRASQTRANSLTRILSSEEVARAVMAKFADPAFVEVHGERDQDVKA